MLRERFGFILVAALLLAGSSLACGSLISGLSGGEASAGGDAGAWTYTEDFYDQSGNWQTGQQGSGEYGYTGDGEYYVTVLTSDFLYYMNTESLFDPVTDVIVEVDARIGEGIDEVGAGVYCRNDPKDHSLYSLEITYDGYYAIYMYDGTQFVPLVDYTRSDLVKQGQGAVNTIRGECIGPNLSLYVNGELAAQATDSTLTDGYYGISATTFPSSDRAKMLFDNFKVDLP